MVHCHDLPSRTQQGHVGADSGGGHPPRQSAQVSHRPQRQGSRIEDSHVRPTSRPHTKASSSLRRTSLKALSSSPSTCSSISCEASPSRSRSSRGAKGGALRPSEHGAQPQSSLATTVRLTIKSTKPARKVGHLNLHNATYCKTLRRSAHQPSRDPLRTVVFVADCALQKGLPHIPR